MKKVMPLGFQRHPRDEKTIKDAFEVYIETANLDGETNLKTKMAPNASFKLVGQHETMEQTAKQACALDMSCVAWFEGTKRRSLSIFGDF